MIGMGRHALVKVCGRERQDNAAHAVQVVDAKLTRPIEGAGRGSDLTGFNQGLDDGQLAMWGAFFHEGIIT